MVDCNISDGQQFLWCCKCNEQTSNQLFQTSNNENIRNFIFYNNFFIINRFNSVLIFYWLIISMPFMNHSSDKRIHQSTNRFSRRFLFIALEKKKHLLPDFVFNESGYVNVTKSRNLEISFTYTVKFSFSLKLWDFVFIIRL